MRRDDGLKRFVKNNIFINFAQQFALISAFTAQVVVPFYRREAVTNAETMEIRFERHSANSQKRGATESTSGGQRRKQYQRRQQDDQGIDYHDGLVG